MIIFREGHEIHGPDGQGYRLTRNVTDADFVKASDFQPFGGAPDPVPGEAMPGWLAAQIPGIGGRQVALAERQVQKEKE